MVSPRPCAGPRLAQWCGLPPRRVRRLSRPAVWLLVPLPCAPSAGVPLPRPCARPLPAQWHGPPPPPDANRLRRELVVPLRREPPQARDGPRPPSSAGLPPLQWRGLGPPVVLHRRSFVEPLPAQWWGLPPARGPPA